MLEPDFVVPSPVTYVNKPPQLVEKKITRKVVAVPICGFKDHKILNEIQIGRASCRERA